jgi:thioredoxin reductase
MFDAIIVGGSFAGLSAATYVARSRRKDMVIDSGRPRNRFAAKSHGFFGHDGESPQAMIDIARAQLLKYPSTSFTSGEVVGIAPDAGKPFFDVTLQSGVTERARRIVLATGVVDELPELSGLRERWGSSVLHCPYCHGFEFGGRRLGVLAMGPMSLHQAGLIQDWGPTTLFTDGAIDLDDAARQQLAKRGVTVEPERVIGLEGASPDLAGVRLKDGRFIPLSALFIGAPIRMASPLAAQLGCAFDETPLGAIIRTGADKQTTVPGIYAAGDAARMPHSVAFAVAEGVQAGISLHQGLIASGL